MCLEEEKDDAKTEFVDKLMNKENSSNQYIEKNGDADVRSFEDLKYYFAETN